MELKGCCFNVTVVVGHSDDEFMKFTRTYDTENFHKSGDIERNLGLIYNFIADRESHARKSAAEICSV